MSDDKVQWLKDRPHLCISPYAKYDFRIRHVGFSVSCCCNLDVGYSDKSSTTALVDEVRETMSRGETHPACWRCHEEEARGHVSERIRSLIGRADEDLKKFDEQGISTNHPDFEIGMKFSNLCNLACRSCDSHDSSTFSKISGRPPPMPMMAVDLSDVPEHWDTITDSIKKTHASANDKQFIIHPIGGETVLQPGVHKLLDWAIESGIAADTMLRVTTSFATPISDELLAKLRQFKKVEFLNSIDSVGENYHHVRWPAKFEKVERNLEMLAELHRRNPQKFPMIGVLPTFSLNNIFYMPEILDFWLNWFKTNRVFGMMITTHLYRPVFLSFDILPIEYRSKLLEIFQQCQDHKLLSNGRFQSLKAYILSTIEILKDPSTANEDLFIDYLKFSADYDRRTGSDSFHGNRKLFDLLAPQHIEVYRQHYDSTNTTIPIYYNDFSDAQF